MQMTIEYPSPAITKFQCFSFFFHQAAERIEVNWSSSPPPGRQSGMERSQEQKDTFMKIREMNNLTNSKHRNVFGSMVECK